MKTKLKGTNNSKFIDEIETLLLEKATEAISPHDSLAVTTPNLEFLIPEPDETHTFQEGLYSVEQGELQPITSPFLVPGIYKKIGVETTRPPASHLSSLDFASNVFMSTMERHGRIVTTMQFELLYDREKMADEPISTVIEQQQSSIPRVVLKEGINNQISPKQTINTISPPPPPPPPPRSLDALSQFSYDLQQIAHRDGIIIDRLKQQIIHTQYNTKLKTLYKFYSPQRLGLQRAVKDRAHELSYELPIRKRGRPRKCPTKQDVNEENENKKSCPEDNPILPISPSTVANIEPQPELRTRSGRLIKILQRDLIGALHPNGEVCKTPQTDAIKDNPPIQSNSVAIESIEPPKNTAISTTKRRVPPEAVCPTCHKIFLGRRLQRHFAHHPDHISPTVQPISSNTQSATESEEQQQQQQEKQLQESTIESPGEEKTLFRFLVDKLQKSMGLNEDQRAELFLNEISDLVEQLQLRSSRLIRNTSGLHMVSPRVARVLNIPEGQYALDMSAIEAPPEFEFPINFGSLPLPGGNHHRGLEYPTISVSLDDTLTDEAVQKLNLSAGGKILPPSEESLLRAVDDFVVRDNMAKLSSANLKPPSAGGNQKPSIVVPHYDHASDNAVEAMTMKETPNHVQQTLEFFQFNN